MSWLACVELPWAVAALAWFCSCVAICEVICLNKLGFCCCTCCNMLKKLAAGEILGESLCVWLAENGFGEVRFTPLPGCKLMGSKLLRELITIPVRLHVHHLTESADNK